MEGETIISPYTLGTLEAYTVVIRDISEVLKDPIIDMRKLFYAVMIQSGLKRFRTPSNMKEFISAVLAERAAPMSFEKLDSKINGLHSCVIKNALPGLKKEQMRTVSDLAWFLTELYIAAEFRRPVATCVRFPKMMEIESVFREDLCIVVGGLLSAVETVNLSVPVARLKIPVKDFSLFSSVMSSNVFEPYVDSHAELETLSNPSARIAEQVSLAARREVDTFPSNFELRKTAVGAIQSIPSIIEVTAGKVFGALAKPLFSTIADAISREQRLILYSFEPTWRQVWGGKLDKVRTILAKERAGKGFLNEGPDKQR
jgi:hypothetical protein